MSLKVYFDLPSGECRECSAEVGQNLLSVAQANAIDLEGSCEASLACATCHVIVDPEWYEQLSPPSLDESDMLDLANGLKRTSRLSCQIILSEDMNGLKVKVP